MLYASLFILLLFVFVNVVSAAQNDTMIVEVDIIAYQDIVSIEVSDKVILNDIIEGEDGYDNSSNTAKINISNTGTVDVIVTPKLNNPNDEIFSYLYFQTKKKSTWPKQRIGDFSFNISKGDNDYFYMWLNLTDINKNIITEDRPGTKTNITFFAIPQV